MKKLTTILSVFIIAICLLLSCGYKGTYDDGYSDGYDDGYFEAQWKYEDDYARGYEDGLIEGKSYTYVDDLEEILFWNDDLKQEMFMYAESEANNYAMEASEWDAESAMAIVYSYLNNEPDIYGDTYNYEEFTEAVMALYYFYEYFYSGLYK